MTNAQRITISRAKGFDLQAASMKLNGLPAVNVARPSIWGNPFIIGEPSGFGFADDGDPSPMIAAMTRDQVIDFYETLVSGMLRPEMHPHGHDWLKRFKKRMRGQHPTEAAWALQAHNLACWCKPDQACHCDVLLKVAKGGAP